MKTGHRQIEAIEAILPTLRESHLSGWLEMAFEEAAIIEVNARVLQRLLLQQIRERSRERSR